MNKRPIKRQCKQKHNTGGYKDKNGRCENMTVDKFGVCRACRGYNKEYPYGP